VTEVAPTGNDEPEGESHVAETAPSTSSMAVTSNSTTALPVLGSLGAVMPAGTLTTGAVTSVLPISSAKTADEEVRSGTKSCATRAIKTRILNHRNENRNRGEGPKVLTRVFLSFNRHDAVSRVFDGRTHFCARCRRRELIHHV
jgi:hypothetical protein